MEKIPMSSMAFISWTITAIWILLGSYAVFTFALTFLWSRIHKPATPTGIPADLFITVIIPVRNEADNILFLLEDLERQTLPVNHFEVLVMDDSSTDNTAAIVRAFAENSKAQVRLIPLPDVRTSAPKKRAIETAVGHAQGKLIVTTDGDCRAQAGWLHAIASCYLHTGAKLISSPVTFTNETSLTDHLQTVEFASLIGSGAASMSAGYPSMCNGANLSYEKETFLEVSGYDGVRHIASGDDEFLMHKIAARHPGSVHFLRHRDAIIRTAPHRNWASFYRQRKRWASKWKHYQSKTPLILAIYIFASNFSILLAGGLACAGAISAAAFGGMLALKCIPEWFFLGSVLSFLQKRRSLAFIPATQLFYPLYVCFFGLAAQKGQYEWKGRKLS
ncbi:cellulose synthase/poly-beta-1,6-N-acetylglucosamine synthase-like glycosyltransferase [Dyadobacter sp. BE34]|uniref:Cellulose synthase/poly-beta-1,6-N-acetylglucosamine synthase-like glycosyltransferase n=1 Tax=Dyadobacter fermentans TaxID=94254 RepID=A0ABU1R740_9BACT|nr:MULTISPECIES: glycosyltransferase [Dyadobacter]MDR6808734.1 cellulose synthase/poly-beta-1,6-N-acetylglucosamine synthase-like glycosyltransferase [Dyadobacter fermentans]MDR7046477.1 cellulose synthase/poly-beta-1,6-N-acetylglucosamine synthase-like glycosyltransferase [Dyadobacter sp. BE242]MDR7200790.1 cellulose synthase/poly-beta-1,6-N-acetylglucosamine synthase-like glycosyltransferase [Dyadobacter sp. BE34]MDR7218750.1 cellulose synthase/poly-beta-1,6-N-acetylglucosamine synthase-like 